MTVLPHKRPARRSTTGRRLPRRTHRYFRPPTPPTADWIPGRYDGPCDTAGRRDEARFLASGGPTVAPIFRANPGACMILLYHAQALDIPVAVALQNLHWSDTGGAGGMTAQLMAGLLKRAGYRYKATVETNQRVQMTFWAPDGKRLGVCSWTMADAIAAGVAGHPLWQAYPADSLWARCLMRGARRFAADVGTGLAYTGRELVERATNTDPDPVPVSVDVQEYLDEAATTGTTSADIKTDILPRARRAKLLAAPAGAGLTLGEALAQMYGTARAREADQADQTPTGDPTRDVRPAGTGELECGCDAATLARTGAHERRCRHA